jgi:queuosine precursor transporter
MVNYAYKFTIAIILTPLIYLLENRMDKYLGKETAHQMKQAAMGMENV